MSVGRIANTVNNSIESIKDPDKIAHFDMRFIKPLDEVLLHKILTNYNTVITVEDGVIKGGFGSAVAEYMIENGYKNNLKILGVPDTFLEHATVEELHVMSGLDCKSIAKIIISLL